MQTMSLEEAIYKMTHKPAVTFKIDNRGLLKEEYFADIVIFDENKIIDKGTFIEPTQFPDGIDYVLVNGKFAVKEGKSTYELGGKVIRIER